jgi:uncharacterized protein (DUF2235 family)
MVQCDVEQLRKREMTAHRRGGYRHLIYFIDGTWLWAGSKTLDVYSNVYRMNTLLNVDARDDHAQIVHYSRGLGAIPDGVISRLMGGTFADGIDVEIADLYVNICSNYQRHDKIYIFGFSRGAVVARALTGLLAKGILDDKHINMFGHVWADYVGGAEVLEPGFENDGTRQKQSIANYKPFCSETHPTIEFLGVFDTVNGGHGLSETAQRLRLRERRLLVNVKNALQVLAIDETRSFFTPIMWTGITSEPVVRSGGSFMEQIWMPGVHSDVGGAYADRTLGNVALVTMVDRVLAKTHLSFDIAQCLEYNQQLSRESFIRIHDERALRYWRLLDRRPVTRRLEDVDQSIHPLALYLQDKIVRYKARKDQFIYQLPPGFKNLKAAPEFLTHHFKSALPATP